MTPIRDVRSYDPSAFLSICSRDWLPPSGPTGTTNRPPGFNWAINCSIQETIISMRLTRDWKITDLVRKIWSSCANVNGIKWSLLRIPLASITNCNPSLKLNGSLLARWCFTISFYQVVSFGGISKSPAYLCWRWRSTCQQVLAYGRFQSRAPFLPS